MSRAAGSPEPPSRETGRSRLDPLTALIATLIIAGFLPELLLQGSTRDDIIVELIKLIGIAISAFASCFAVYLARQNARTSHRVEDKVDRNRVRVRSTDTPKGEPTQVTVVEDRRGGERK